MYIMSGCPFYNNQASEHFPFHKKRLTHRTTCLCLSTQYLMADRTRSSCFFVSPFGPTEPLFTLTSAPVFSRKLEKSCWLLYIARIPSPSPENEFNMRCCWGRCRVFWLGKRLSASRQCFLRGFLCNLDIQKCL